MAVSVCIRDDFTTSSLNGGLRRCCALGTQAEYHNRNRFWNGAVRLRQKSAIF
jgi:hypothetical protein